VLFSTALTLFLVPVAYVLLAGLADRLSRRSRRRVPAVTPAPAIRGMGGE
jgi:hypothetical protein